MCADSIEELGEDLLWPRVFHGRFVESVARMDKNNRTAVVSRVSELLRGTGWVVRGSEIRRSPSAKSCVSEEFEQHATTQVGAHYIVWWVEVSARHRCQAIVFHDVVLREALGAQEVEVAKFFAKYSARYLKGCRKRLAVRDERSERWIMRPVPIPASQSLCDEFQFRFSGECRVLEEEPDDPMDIPVSLQKRFQIDGHLLRYLVQGAMRNVTAEYEFDDDEEAALQMVGKDVVFLLGRSGSGKTSVLARALSTISVADEDGASLSAMLLTKSSILAASICRHVQRLQTGHHIASGRVTTQMADLAQGAVPGQADELGLVDGAPVLPLPASFLTHDYSDSWGPLVSDWPSFLRRADVTVPGPRFFRVLHHTDAERAIHRHRLAMGSLGGDSGVTEDNELTFEFAAREFAPRLATLLPCSFHDFFKETRTVIEGSLDALRSDAGTLSRSEYVSGSVDLGDSLYKKDPDARAALYSAYENYRELKRHSRRFDPAEPVRNIIRRIKMSGIPGLRPFGAFLVDEVQDLLPVQVALLRYFCPNLSGFVFAGDTAQTIVKGVEFRFESIRRLFYEYFIVCDRPKVSEPKEVRHETCAQCGEHIVTTGGAVFTCSNFCSGRFTVCGKEECKDSFEAWCTRIAKDGGRGSRRKLDFAKRWNKLNCPHCQISMREEPLVVDESAANNAPAPSKHAVSVRRKFHNLPDVCQLRHNHRATAGPLNLANSLVDTIARLFPGRIDLLQRELAAVSSRTLPVVLSGMDIQSARRIAGGEPEDDTLEVEFGAQQAVLVFSDEDQQRMKDIFDRCNVLTIDECKGLEFHDVLLLDPFEALARSVPQGRRLWQSAVTSASLNSDCGVLCAWLKSLYVAVTRARRRVWIWCEGDPQQGLLSMWESQGLVRIVRSVGDLSRGERFAVTSTADEWMEQGISQIGHELWTQARHCFLQAQAQGHASGESMASFATARSNWQVASQMMDSNHRRRLLRDAATIFLNLESQTPAALRAFPLPLYAAMCYTEAGDFHDGARLFERCGRLVEASDCYEAGGFWREAGDCCRRFDVWRSMKNYARSVAWNLCSNCCGEALSRSTSSCTGPTDFIRWLCTARCGAHGLLTRDLTLDMRERLNNVLRNLLIHVDEALRQELVRTLPCPVFKMWFHQVNGEGWRNVPVALKELRKAEAPKARSGWFQKTLAVVQEFRDPEDISVLESLRTLTDGLVTERSVKNDRASEAVSQPAVREGLLLRTDAEAFTRFVQGCSRMEVPEALRGAVERFKNIAMWFSRRTPLESLLTSTRAEDAAALCRAVGADSVQASMGRTTPRKTFETIRLLRVARG